MQRTAPLLLSFILFLSLVLEAQTVFNGSLEYWEVQGETVSLLLKENPKGWTSRNHTDPLPQAIYCFKTTDSYAGQRAALLQNYTTSNGFIQSAFLSLGAFNEEEPGQKGIAFSYRPYSMHFAYKYFTTDINPDGFYSAKAIIELSKWDESTGKRIIVGRGEEQIIHKVSFYKPTEVLVNYFTTDEPDSLQIIFATANNPNDQVRFTVDDIYLQMESNTVSNDDKVYPDQVNVLPNPVMDQLTILNPLNLTDASILVFNAMGQLLLNEQVAGANAKIDCTQLTNGLYYYQIRQADELLKAGKLMKQNIF
jgi:Secretion system C-terminal sorting domain